LVVGRFLLRKAASPRTYSRERLACGTLRWAHNIGNLNCPEEEGPGDVDLL
jgi:hypothetical protein